MGSWESLPRLLILLLLSCNSQAGRSMQSNVCKWCDNTNPLCEDRVCYSNCGLSSYCEKPEEICVSIWKQENESVRVTTLCHNPYLPVENVMVPKYDTSQCVMARQQDKNGIFYICGCVHEQECNDKLIFENHADGYSMLQSKEIIPVAAISLLPPLLVAIMTTLIFYLCRTHRQRRIAKEWAQKQMQRHRPPESSGNTSYVEILSVKIDSHSTRRSGCSDTINDSSELLPIELDERVGKGQFAEVWKAKLKQASPGSQYKTVAVKIFPFLLAEERHSGLQKEYWLITAYHSQGNLKDYLSRTILTWKDLQKMAGSLVSGVAHLHSDYTACGRPKVPIAHRDIKSTNILMKSGQECVLCDFGNALRLDPALSVEEFANSGQVGTARYMAPEVLESRVNLEDLESFKQMDVYSMSLVLWEIASRCDVIGEVKSYELPFGAKVREQPCMEVMRDIVLHGRGRPEMASNWLVHQGMHFLCDTITECWDHDPEARLTAHCVAERFNLMAQTNCDDIINNNNIDNGTSKMNSPREESQNSDRSIQ
ncbi:hypothetical protein JRQ81_001814 [Phrynocephalus forsythii]|uniref:Serine/threonine-protein kinase receptor n=1 Tax=Phrynocephalus forsythii TaxID=171643 RepID=A0A9Q0YBU0_9SAUR|nr:hypothetical protein JRQ81_001814 [Phrynocephalus forsythii]